MKCHLPLGHAPPHMETFFRGESGSKVTVTWEEDEREVGVEKEELEEEEEEGEEYLAWVSEGRM